MTSCGWKALEAAGDEIEESISFSGSCLKQHCKYQCFWSKGRKTVSIASVYLSPSFGCPDLFVDLSPESTTVANFPEPISDPFLFISVKSRFSRVPLKFTHLKLGRTCWDSDHLLNDETALLMDAILRPWKEGEKVGARNVKVFQVQKFNLWTLTKVSKGKNHDSNHQVAPERGHDIPDTCPSTHLAN